MQTGGSDPGGQTGGSKGALKQGLYLQSTAGQVRVYCAHQQGLSAHPTRRNVQEHAKLDMLCCRSVMSLSGQHHKPRGPQQVLAGCSCWRDRQQLEA